MERKIRHSFVVQEIGNLREPVRMQDLTHHNPKLLPLPLCTTHQREIINKIAVITVFEFAK